MTYCIGLVYSEIETQLSEPIPSCLVFDENQIGQWCDRSYKCGLRWKEIELLWSIGLSVIYDENIQENDVTNHVDAIYAKNDIKVSWLIKSGADCNENQIRQLHDLSYRHGLRWKQNWVAWQIKPSTFYDEN